MQSSSSQAEDALDSIRASVVSLADKASRELEKTVHVLMAQLAQFNQSLEKALLSQARAANERLDLCLAQNLEQLGADKNELVKALAAHKQTEILRLVDTGAATREALERHADETTAALTQSIRETLSSLRSCLVLSTPELALAMEGYENRLTDSAAAGFQSAAQALDNYKMKGMAEASEIARQFAEEAAAVSAPAGVLVAGAKEDSSREDEEFTRSLAEGHELFLAELSREEEDSSDRLKESCRQSQEEMDALAAANRQFMSSTFESFQQSLLDMSAIMSRHYESDLRSLLARSRKEIIGASDQAKEKLLSTRAELQGALRSYERDYVAAVRLHLSRLEKLVDQEMQEQYTAELDYRGQRYRDQLDSIFRKIGEDILNSASTAAAQMESDFQKSIETFGQRIDAAKDSASESLERESKLMQKELNRSYQDFEKQLAEMELQLSRLEKAGRDAAEIVMTMRQANLDFERKDL